MTIYQRAKKVTSASDFKDLFVLGSGIGVPCVRLLLLVAE
jgi:hypothetical protein